MTMRHLALVLLAVVFARVKPAAACSCNGTPRACVAIFEDTTFVGRVTSLAMADPMKVRTTIEVVETLYSAKPLPKQVTIDGTTGTCDVMFQRDTTYVIYATRDNTGALHVSGCGRTHELAPDDPDVAIARAAAKATTGAIEGRIELRADDKLAPIAGVEVLVGGMGAKTDANGEFRLALKAGRYPFSIATAGLRVTSGIDKVVVVPKAGRCTAPYIQVTRDKR